MLRVLRSLAPVLALFPVFGCASALSQPVGPKTWLLRCESSLVGCANRAKQLCRDEGFWIVRGHSYSRLLGIEGNQVEEGEHEMVIECGIPPEDQRQAMAAAKAPGNGPRPPARDHAEELLGTQCVPGETRECVGPGACRGGQQCVPEGSGFGTCDCGKPAASAPPPSTGATEPAPTQSPASGNATTTPAPDATTNATLPIGATQGPTRNASSGNGGPAPR